MMLTSPRRLLLRHNRKIPKATASAVGDSDVQTQAPGYEQLSSFELPGLQDTTYTVQVDQYIKTSKENKLLSSTQAFTVVGPRFALPANAVHSVYPPQGHQDGAECLPHVVFNDPTFPWERPGSKNDNNPNNIPPDYRRNRTPWLAVLVFTEDELKLADSTLQTMFSKVQGVPTPLTQSPSLAVNVPVSQLANILNTTTPVTYDERIDGTPSSDIVLVPQSLFVTLFTQYSSSGAPITGSAYTRHHRFLAHKRTVNTAGMAVASVKAAAANNDNDTTAYGVVLAHRTGPSDIVQPTPVYVHLVSIEGVEQMKPWPPGPGSQYVAMSSLLSWSYVCMPPSSLNVHDEFVGLGHTIAPLCPSITLNSQQSNLPQAAEILERLHNGFTLARYRVQTGESTACFIRGPFIPTGIPSLPDTWPRTSMVGSDYQILDRDVSIMDVSYSAAWQLGRTMALANASFVAALCNVRKQIMDRSQAQARENILRQLSYFKNRQDLLRAIPSALNRLSSRHVGIGFLPEDTYSRRWKRATVEPIDLASDALAMQDELSETIPQAAQDVASSPHVDKPNLPSDIPYDEYNTPFSADWVVVLRWVMDRYFLSDVPAHYLFTDASHLPQESIRFFNIDPNWTDAVVDGALSLGNHEDQQSDPVRNAIKEHIVRYETVMTATRKYLPPKPTYGCYIHSALVSKFPDLMVSILPEPSPGSAPILLRHEIVEETTMLCLFSSSPSTTTWQTLTLTQPPHQQSFISANKISPTSGSNDGATITMTYRRAYTVPDPEGTDPQFGNPLVTPDPSWTVDKTGSSPMYVWQQSNQDHTSTWDVRALLIENLALDYIQKLEANMNSAGNIWFSDTTASSALLALQLSNPAWSLKIDLAGNSMLSALSVPSKPLSEPQNFRNAVVLPVRPAKRTLAARRPSVAKRNAQNTITDVSVSDRRRRLAAPPPHQPAIRSATSIPSTPKITPVEPIGVAEPPKYNYAFYPANTPPSPGSSPNNITIPMGGAPQDIIFSIVLTSAKPAWLTWPLASISIYIPYGDPSTAPRPVLTARPTSQATMLSNLRFNPRLSTANGGTSLLIQLIPRSSSMIVYVGSCLELSFILSGVWVTEVTSSPYNVVPTIEESYALQGIKKPTQYPDPSFKLVPSKG